MSTRTWLLPMLVTLALTAAPASAVHCNGEITEIRVEGETLYMDDRSSQGEPRPYVYLETNDVPGLQTGNYNNPVCEDTGPVCFPIQLLWSFVYRDPCEHHGYSDLRLA